jgi:hypothetical protein
MNRPSNRRAWIGLTSGIIAGYAVLAVVLWMQDDRMTAAAMGLSLAATLVSLRALRRRRCGSSPATDGTPG